MRPLRSAALLIVFIIAGCSASPEALVPSPDGSVTRLSDGAVVAGRDAPVETGPDSPIVIHDGDAGVELIFDPCVPEPLSGYDPVASGLTACCEGTGAAHCVPTGQINPKLVEDLAGCPGSESVCMPDPIVRAGGKYQPPACTSSITQSAGVCLSKCIPLVSGNPLASLLGQDSCGGGELCIPCENPIDHTPTGACSLIESICTKSPDAGVAPDAGSDCPHTGPPVIDPTSLPGCSPTCGGAHCLPATLVPTAQQSLLASCSATGGVPGLCAPDELIAAGGNLVPQTCTSVAGAEGRCLSTCLPDIAEKAGLLPKDVCADDQRCAPCFDPTSSDPTAPTGACTLSCDRPAQPPTIITCPWTGPPVIDATTLPECNPTCGGSHCIPSTLVPASLQPLLATCSGGFCAPDSFIESAGNVKPRTCTSAAGAEGRCLSTCLPPIADRADLLPKDICDDGEVCAPCFDPTSSEPTAATGACTIGCDLPTKPPVILQCPWHGPSVVSPLSFPSCEPVCGGAHCVPGELVPSLLQPLLNTCGDNGFCTPDPFISTAGNFRPPTCASVAGSEGRCLSVCLPEVADKVDLLPRDSCATNERCVPCFDPTSSDPTQETGACTTTCDRPRTDPVVLTCPWNGPPVIDPGTFPACGCGNMHCVPADMIPEDQQGLLAACEGGFCAPDGIIATDNHFVPKTCTSVAGSEGRCLPSCLPPIADQAAFLPQSSCAEGEKCAPCFDPTSADPTQPTGACSIACDLPKEPPVVLTCPWTGPAVLDPATLPSCAPACGGSHCLPADLVPPAERGLLATCPGGFCTPDQIIQTDNNFVPPTCQSIAGVEGRCLSSCLPEVSGQPLLPRSTCGAAEKCVPCYDPTAADFTAPTGACSLGCDHPANPPTQITCPWNGPAVIDPSILPQCAPSCQGSHCLPSQYVPAEERGLLATCPGGFCTPDEIIRAGGEWKPFSCNAFSGTAIPGRCLSTCLPSVANELGQLEQTSCSDGQRCAPCADPFSGADTGACSISCDLAPRPPVTFPKCCFQDNRSSGTCVPRTQIPDDEEGNLLRDACPADAYRCVPNELLPSGNGGRGCEEPIYLFFVDGTCLSNCLDLGAGDIFPQSDCQDNHTCVPCAFAPDGSPGC